MDVNHGVTGEQDAENQVGGNAEGTHVLIHPNPGFYSHPDTFPDLTKSRD